MILITGANGLLGSFIVQELVSQGFRPRCLSRVGSDLSLLSSVKDKIDLVQGDILDIISVEQHLKGIDTVIHAAAIISFSKSDYDIMFKTNVEGTANLINLSLTKNVKKFLFISSVASLGRAKRNLNIDETAVWENSPHNTWYAKTKYLAELEVWRGSEEGLNTIIINPSIILGAGDISKSSTRIFNHVLRNSPFYPLGIINFVDVRDVAEIAIRLLNENTFNERFIMSAESISYYIFFKTLALKLNKKVPDIPVGPLLSNLAWRCYFIKSLIDRKKPLVTKESSRSMQNLFTYNNSKIKKKLDFNFRTLDSTISWIANYLQSK